MRRNGFMNRPSHAEERQRFSPDRYTSSSPHFNPAKSIARFWFYPSGLSAAITTYIATETQTQIHRSFRSRLFLKRRGACSFADQSNVLRRHRKSQWQNVLYVRSMAKNIFSFTVFYLWVRAVIYSVCQCRSEGGAVVL